MSVIYGTAVLDANGFTRWHHPIFAYGEGVVGNFGANLNPGIVVLGGAVARIAMLRQDGSLAWGPSVIPGGRGYVHGGPPVVADFDGDGIPEIGVAT